MATIREMQDELGRRIQRCWKNVFLAMKKFEDKQRFDQASMVYLRFLNWLSRVNEIRRYCDCGKPAIHNDMDYDKFCCGSESCCPLFKAQQT